MLKPRPANDSALPDLDAEFLRLRRVWWGLGIAAVTCAGAVLVLARLGVRPSASLAPPVEFALAATGGLASVASFILRPILLSPSRLAAKLEAGGARGVLEAVHAAYIIVWVLAGEAAGMGLLLRLLGARPVLVYGLVACGAVFVFVQAPTVNTLPGLLDAAEQERQRTRQ